MHLMDDIAPWPPVEEEVIKVDRWAIKLSEDRYRITHAHEGYDWGVDSSWRNSRARGCIHCGEEVPQEALGFLELLKWER